MKHLNNNTMILQTEGLPNLQKYIDEIKRIQLKAADDVQRLTEAFNKEKERQKVLKAARDKEIKKLAKSK